MFELLGKKRKATRLLPEIAPPAISRWSDASGVVRRRIESEHGDIAVLIDPDGQPLDASLSFAERVMKDMPSLDERSRSLVAVDGLDVYNSDWRFGERLNGAGIMEMFEKPRKSTAEFCASLTLFMVQVTGSQRVTLRFACGEMSSVHTFSVTAFDGIDFNDVRVELHG